MRSQKEDGEQQRGPQPDHTLEADQVSQDKLSLRSVSLGLAAGPVLISACWCWGGRGNEVAWVGGVAVKGWGGLTLLLLTAPPQSSPHKAGDGCGLEGPGMGSLEVGERCKDRPRDYVTGFPISSFPFGPQSCQQAGGRRQEREEASGFRLLRRDGGGYCSGVSPPPST